MVISFKKANEELDLRTKEQKKFERQMWLRRSWDTTANFVRTNLDVLAVLTPVATVVIGGGTKIISKAIANHTANKVLRDKECSVYDRSLGRYAYLKRPMTASQALTFEERRANGEKVNTILEDMGLLRK